jgi:hypothetical protein
MHPHSVVETCDRNGGVAGDPADERHVVEDLLPQGEDDSNCCHVLSGVAGEYRLGTEALAVNACALEMVRGRCWHSQECSVHSFSFVARIQKTKQNNNSNENNSVTNKARRMYKRETCSRYCTYNQMIKIKKECFETNTFVSPSTSTVCGKNKRSFLAAGVSIKITIVLFFLVVCVF